MLRLLDRATTHLLSDPWAARRLRDAQEVIRSAASLVSSWLESESRATRAKARLECARAEDLASGLGDEAATAVAVFSLAVRRALAKRPRGSAARARLDDEVAIASSSANRVLARLEGRAARPSVLRLLVVVLGVFALVLIAGLVLAFIDLEGGRVWGVPSASGFTPRP